MEDQLTRQARILTERLATRHESRNQTDYRRAERVIHAHIRACGRYWRRYQACLDLQYIYTQPAR